MKHELLNSLRCPVCRGTLDLEIERAEGDEIESGRLSCKACAKDYQITGFIPRFVPKENYAGNFGFQWNQFRRTQLDSYSGVDVSRKRFLESTGVHPDELKGKLVLDVGCGAGRFAEVALSLGARLIALDYSTAVDACYANLGSNPNLSVVQGDVYQLPFPLEHFDFVYCLGVLQHTPDVGRAFAELPRFVKRGGTLAVDVYPRLVTNVFWSKYWLRPLTKRMPQPVLFKWVQRAAPALLPLSDALSKVPGFRRRLRYLVPVANYRGVIPLSDQQLREWAVLDTFDMLAPAHDHPQSAETLEGWFKAAGMEDVRISRPGHIVGRGRKP